MRDLAAGGQGSSSTQELNKRAMIGCSVREPNHQTDPILTGANNRTGSKMNHLSPAFLMILKKATGKGSSRPMHWLNNSEIVADWLWMIFALLIQRDTHAMHEVTRGNRRILLGNVGEILDFRYPAEAESVGCRCSQTNIAPALATMLINHKLITGCLSIHQVRFRWGKSAHDLGKMSHFFLTSLMTNDALRFH